jgi:hypothetical protein
MINVTLATVVFLATIVVTFVATFITLGIILAHYCFG